MSGLREWLAGNRLGGGKITKRALQCGSRPWWGQWEEKTDVSDLQFEEITLYLVAPGTYLWYKAAHWLLLTCISVPQGY